MIRRLFALGAVVAVLGAACTYTAREQSPRASGRTFSAASTGGRSVEGVVDRVLPSVVNVTTDVFQADPLGGGQQGQGVGTGFIIRPDGIIVTNCHVVEGATRITVFTSDETPDEYQARVIGGDCLHDLAVLKIDAEGLPTVKLGSSSSLRLGQQVVALGYALALEGGPTVTTGIVSSLNRTIRAQDPQCEVCPNGVRTYNDALQTDAAINHGNSGGPLVDMSGRVVGINSAGADTAENIGFAIAIDSVRDAIRDAIANPLAATAYLGVSTREITRDLAFQLALPVENGAFVLATTNDGPAAGAGISEGDVIVQVDGRQISSPDDLGAALEALKPGQTVEIKVVSPSGQERVVSVKLGARPLPVELP